MLAKPEIYQSFTFFIRDWSPVHARVSLVEGTSEQSEVVAHLKKVFLFDGAKKQEVLKIPPIQRSNILHFLRAGN